MDTVEKYLKTAKKYRKEDGSEEKYIEFSNKFKKLSLQDIYAKLILTSR